MKTEKMKRMALSTIVAAITFLLTTSGSSQAIVEEYQPDEHTWALYHFNDDFLDSSGNNRHLTTENPSGYIGFADSWHPFLGRCLHILQQYNDFHNQPRIKSSELRYPGTGSWTVEAQIYVPVENTTGATVARHYSEHWGGHDPYELSYLQNGEIVWAIQVGDDSWIISHPMTKGTWHHVAGVYDDSMMTHKLYLDGNLVDEISSPRPENLQAYNVYIGGSWFGLQGRVYLDELRISNIARTEFIVPEPPTTYHVDGATGDNTNDGLTRETAFATIQRGINMAQDGDTVLVWPGVYNDEIGFWGDAITVKSAADAAVVETDYGYAFSFFSAEGPDTVLSNFIIRDSEYGIYLVNGSSPTLSNLTIVNNDFGISAFDGSDPDISNCILWGNYYGDLFRDPVPLEAKYSFVQEEIEANLVSYWSFDNPNEPAHDDSGNGYDGILESKGGAPIPTPCEDCLGNPDSALCFGHDRWINIPTLTGYFPYYTVSCWFKAKSIPGILICKGRSGSDVATNFCISIKDDGRIDGEHEIDGTQGVHVYSSTVVEMGKCYHVALTFDGTHLRLYLDSSQDNSTQAGTPYDLGRWPVDIGANGEHDGFFDGAIDDVVIYDRSLSAEEVQAIYEAGLAGLSYGEPGFVDANSGDYHLLSERGRYWPAHDVWVLDDVTSPCVDSGDPTINPSNERMPNGGRINMGAYGNSAYASMSEWPLEHDSNRDGTVNMLDFAKMAQEWLETLPWAINEPPEVTITNPEDGSTVPYNTIDPVPVEADASDIDGSVEKVEFFANGDKIGQDNDGSDGWAIGWHPESDSSFNLTAKATDNDAATATSPIVQVQVGYVW